MTTASRTVKAAHRAAFLMACSVRYGVFRSLKSELSIRPIRHQLEHRADAHVLIAFLAYCLQVTLKNRLMLHAPGLTPAAVFRKPATIQMVEVWIPMVDGRRLVLPRHTQPEKDVQALLNQIRITLPSQPPARIKASQIHQNSSPILLPCSEDLRVALTDFERVSSRKPLEVRKSG